MSSLKQVLPLLIVLAIAYALLTHRPFVVGVPEEELDALDEKYMRWFWLRPVCFLGLLRCPGSCAGDCARHPS